MKLTVKGAVTALAAAALVCLPTAAAVGPPAGLHGALELRVVSSPPQYVSGGDARIEVAVPDVTPLADVHVTLNGADVTSAFAQDPEGNHQLEGVVTGLPLGPSTLDGDACRDRARRSRTASSSTLVNHALNASRRCSRDRGSRCSSARAPNRLAAADLTTPGAEPSCAFPTQVKWMYRTTGGRVEPLHARRAASGRHGDDDHDGRRYRRLHRPLGARHDRPLHLLDRDALARRARAATPDLSAWNGVLLDKFEGGVAIGHYQGNPQRNSMLYAAGPRAGLRDRVLDGQRDRDALQPPARRRDGDHGQGPVRLRYGEPRYTVAVGGSGGAIQQYVYGQNHPGLLDAAIPQYSYPDMVTQTIHVGDCELLERWADSRAIAEGPLSTWATWVNRSLIEGLNAQRVAAEPVRGADAVDADAGLDRVHQRLARTLAARAQPVVRHGSRRHAAGAAVHGVDALGRPRQHLRHRRHGLRARAVGQRRRPVRAAGAARGQDHARASSST